MMRQMERERDAVRYGGEGRQSGRDEEEGRRDVVRSAGLNYPDVLAQIRLPVYAHNALRNVQSTGTQPPSATFLSSSFIVAVDVPPPPPLSRPEQEEAEEKELEPMYPHVCSLCVQRLGTY